ncbi:MAG: FixG Ig-like domain-containing protein [Hydrogenophaga sp.]|jgi:polyferredoxin|nr:FixG Ig-like domain-containing protein [Hydrogenophaga sp.]
MPDAFSRDRGALARQTGNGDVENTYRLQITNSLAQARGYTVRISGTEELRLETASAHKPVEVKSTFIVPRY